jgi:hypothetical protein
LFEILDGAFPTKRKIQKVSRRPLKFWLFQWALYFRPAGAISGEFLAGSRSVGPLGMKTHENWPFS